MSRLNTLWLGVVLLIWAAMVQADTGNFAAPDPTRAGREGPPPEAQPYGARFRFPSCPELGLPGLFRGNSSGNAT